MVDKLRGINAELMKIEVKGEDVVRMFNVLTAMPDLISEAKTLEATVSEVKAPERESDDAAEKQQEPGKKQK